VLIASAEGGEGGGLRGKEIPRTQPPGGAGRVAPWPHWHRAEERLFFCLMQGCMGPHAGAWCARGPRARLQGMRCIGAQMTSNMMTGPPGRGTGAGACPRRHCRLAACPGDRILRVRSRILGPIYSLRATTHVRRAMRSFVTSVSGPRSSPDPVRFCAQCASSARHVSDSATF
jgi:hypothetical protein